MVFNICPFCQNPLEPGTFHSRGSNYYLPDGEKLPSLYSEEALKKRNAIALPPSPYSFEIKPKVPAAFACRHCGYILIPYEEIDG